jgi:putative ABC transport system permease protein
MGTKMYIKLYILQFFNDLKKQKLRAFLTLFGLIWGTTAIMLLLAMGEGIKKQLYKSMRGMGEQIVIIWPGKTSIPYKGFGKGRWITYYPEDIEFLRKTVPEMGSISGEVVVWEEKGRYKKQELTFQVVGVEPEWAEMRNVIPDSGGRFLHPEDITMTRRVVFLGNRLKDNLFKEEDALGKYIQIGGFPFQVIGVLKPKIQTSDYSGRDHDKAIIPITTHMIMYNEKTLNNVVYKPADVSIKNICYDKLKANLARKKSFDINDPDAISRWDTSDMDDFAFYFSLGLQLFMGVVGVFTLIVAGIGVANIMHVIVEERTKEIGIKMALGIKKAAIMLQFLFETFLFTFIGGFIGYLISSSVCSFLLILNVEEMGKPQVTAFVGITTTLVLGSVAFFSGFFPAKRAANLNPVDALRW